MFDHQIRLQIRENARVHDQNWNQHQQQRQVVESGGTGKNAPYRMQMPSEYENFEKRAYFIRSCTHMKAHMFELADLCIENFSKTLLNEFRRLTLTRPDNNIQE